MFVVQLFLSEREQERALQQCPWRKERTALDTLNVILGSRLPSLDSKGRRCSAFAMRGREHPKTGCRRQRQRARELQRRCSSRQATNQKSFPESTKSRNTIAYWHENIWTSFENFNCVYDVFTDWFYSRMYITNDSTLTEPSSTKKLRWRQNMI